MEGKEKTGVSLMRVEEGLDSGAVSSVKEIEIKDMNAGELEDKLSIMGSDLIEEFIRDVEEDKVNFTPQDEAKKTYAKKILKDDLQIDFKKNSKEIVNQIRGLSPHYGGKFTYNDKVLKIFDAEEIDSSSDKNPGTILKADKELIIKSLDGAISVKKIQAPGKRAMGIDDFLRGNKFEENYVIGGK